MIHNKNSSASIGRQLPTQLKSKEFLLWIILVIEL